MQMLRRHLLSLGLIQSLSGPLSAFRVNAQLIEHQCDVVVIGAGAAGLTAAALLSDSGIGQIIILESEPIIGGTTLISGGFWAVCATNMQRALGIADSDKAFETDIFETGQYLNRPDVVKAFIKHNRAQYEWVRSHLGLEPKTLVPGAGIRRTHAFDARALVAALYRYVHRRGVTILTNTRATRLIMENGRVVGCEAQTGHRLMRIRCKHSVLLASGGFSRNRELLTQFSPRMQFVTTIAVQGSRGDGLRMAMQIHAALADTEHMEASYAFTLNPSTVWDMSLLPYYGGIMVNQDSRRFVDESLPYKQLAAAVLNQKGGKSWIVFDERIRQIALRQKLDHRLWEPISQGIIPPYVHTGESLEQATIRAGLDPLELKRTVETYNRASRGTTKLRGPLSVGDGHLMPIEKPPFYIMPATVCLLGTYGGVAINGRAQVLNTKGQPIPGLYAAGEVAGGFHGASFIMGTAFGKANTFGRIAALSILEEAL